uniref:Sorting nexin-13 n=1 Tax=Ascaris suum TaxID=6253 RepID=F1KUE5_ASCSU
MAIMKGSWRFYGLLAASLFLSSFGFSTLGTIISLILCFITGFIVFALKSGYENSERLFKDFDEIAQKHRFSCGIPRFIATRERFVDKSNYEQEHSMAQSPLLDPILEQILGYVIRDFVDNWYGTITPDQLFKESLKRSTRRTIAAFSQCVRKVDFVPLLTQHIVDDFASHLRLYRKAKEHAQSLYGDNYTNDELEAKFFDLELEMEKCYCRDLVSTTPQYENAYLHDVTDILLYLLMPSEDFRSRPLRFLVREITVRRIILPVLDMFSDPDYINHIVVWLLSEVQLRSEDFIMTLETSKDVQELEAILESLCDEAAALRAKDTGGEQGVLVKQQLASIDYVGGIIKRRMGRLTATPLSADSHTLSSANVVEDEALVQLPIHVVLTNNIGVTHFTDFLASVGGQNLIDCYLAIEGFKVSVEHQLRGLAIGETLERDVYETIKEAANFLYHQYLSQEAITRVSLDDAIVNKFLSLLRNDESPDIWFEQIQEKIMDILKNDERFYPAFKKDVLYVKMLAELGINSDESEAGHSNNSSASDDLSMTNSSNVLFVDEQTTPKAEVEKVEDRLKEGTHVIIETLGIGQQGKQTFALYNVRVSRVDNNGKSSSGWNVLRRYSDFHTLHSLIQSKYPKLNNLCFPGKKTFNNLDSHFLEKRTKALNVYMMSILKPSVLEANPGLEQIIFNFLSQKDYVGEREGLSKKVVNAMFDPIRLGVRAFGNAVTAVPDSVYGGVTRMGDGINKAAQQIIGTQPQQNQSNINNDVDSSRVAAAFNDQQWMESIPLRVLVLMIDEVFGVRGRNAWFRRRLVALLRQFVHATMGSSINRKIIDIVQWLTSQQQVAQYLVAFRNALWPGGQLAETTECRSHASQLRTRVLARTLLLGALPDELRLFFGTETTNMGISNIVDALQNRRLNRRLLYVLFERLLITIFPDNRFEKIFPQLHSKSPRTKTF